MKIVVLGAGGMLGHMMFRRLARDFQGDDIRGWTRDFDVGDETAVNRSLDAIRPDVILNCIGIISQRPRPTAETIYINALLPHRLVNWCAIHNSRLIHFSSDCVFDGKRGNYTEADEPNATDLYGRTKMLGEVVDQLSALTIRTSIIGPELTHHTGLLDWFLSQRGKQVEGFVNALYSGTTTPELAQIIGMVIHDYPTLNGLYQVAGEPITKYSLLWLINRIFGLDIDLKERGGTMVDRSMDASKFGKDTGYKSPKWTELVKGLHDALRE